MSGGSDKHKSTSAQPWQMQQPYLQDIMATGHNLYQQQSDIGAMPSRQIDPNSNITQGWQGTIDYANSVGKGVTGQTQQGWGTLLSSMDVANNPLVQAQIAQTNKQVADDFKLNIMPSIQSDAFGMGQTGSSRQGVAEGLAAKGAVDAMTKGAVGIMDNAYRTGSQNVQSAMTFAPQMYGMGNMQANTIGQVGQNQAAWEQAALDDKYNQWMYQQNRPWELASMYQGLVTGNYGGTATT